MKGPLFVTFSFPLWVLFLLFGVLSTNAFLSSPIIPRTHQHHAPILRRGQPPRAVLNNNKNNVIISSALQMWGLAETLDYCLAHYQLPTESALSACLAAMGDGAAQLRSANQNNLQDDSNNNVRVVAGPMIDWRRLNAFFIKGAVSGVLWSHWYALVDPVGVAVAENLAPSSASIEAARIVVSVFLDLFVFSPFLFCVWDLPFPMLARGDPLESIPRKVRAKIGPILADNTKVWMVPNLVIYSLPVQYRVVVTSCTDAVWQMMLSDQLAKPLPIPTKLLMPTQPSSGSLGSSRQSSLDLEQQQVLMETLAEQRE
uniref:Uncharacterized protein n=1 Tax=Amphora coffeiformis TaxID=265554 RepID=A0A7S3L1K8_9STRA